MLPDFSRLTIGTAAPKRNLSEVDGEGGEGDPDVPSWAGELMQEFKDKKKAQKEAPARAEAAKVAEEEAAAKKIADKAKNEKNNAAAEVNAGKVKEEKAANLAKRRVLQAADDVREEAAKKRKNATNHSSLEARRAVRGAVQAGYSAVAVEALKHAARKAEQREREAFQAWNREWGIYAMSMKPARVYVPVKDRK